MGIRLPRICLRAQFQTYTNVVIVGRMVQRSVGLAVRRITVLDSVNGEIGRNTKRHVRSSKRSKLRPPFRKHNFGGSPRSARGSDAEVSSQWRRGYCAFTM